MLEGARRLETLCLSVQDTLNVPVAQVRLDRQEVFIELHRHVSIGLSLSSASQSVLSAPPEAADGQTRFWKDLPADGECGGEPGPGPESGQRGACGRHQRGGHAWRQAAVAGGCWRWDVGSLSRVLMRRPVQVGLCLGSELNWNLYCRQERLRPFLKADALSPASTGPAPLATPHPARRAHGAPKTLLHPRGGPPDAPGSALRPGESSSVQQVQDEAVSKN